MLRAGSACASIPVHAQTQSPPLPFLLHHCSVTALTDELAHGLLSVNLNDRLHAFTLLSPHSCPFTVLRLIGSIEPPFCALTRVPKLVAIPGWLALPCAPAHVPHSCFRSPPATTSRSGRSVITSGIYSACGGSVV